MTGIRILINDKAVSNLKAPGSGQYRARDTQLKGFHVIVGRRSKTFAVQGDLRKDQQLEKVICGTKLHHKMTGVCRNHVSAVSCSTANRATLARATLPPLMLARLVTALTLPRAWSSVSLAGRTMTQSSEVTRIAASWRFLSL